MKKKSLEIASILLLFDVLIIISACIFPGIFPESSSFKYMNWDRLSSLGMTQTNSLADSLIRVYEQEDSTRVSFKVSQDTLYALKRKKEGAFIFNNDSSETSFLDAFFCTLADTLRKTKFRIAHYGDSQLEGDRVSCFLRQKFQNKFGGKGMGFLPVCDLATPIDFVSSASDNWTRYTVFHNRAKGNTYGISGTFFRFSKQLETNEEEVVTSHAKHGVSCSAWVQYRVPMPYDSLWIGYGNAVHPCCIRITDLSTGEKILNDTLPTVKGSSIFRCNLQAAPSELKIEFSSESSPDIYGVYMDGKRGIQLDNYAIRGHSGDGLLIIDPSCIQQQMELTQTKLIIFQYGANMVPYIKDQKDVDLLEKLYAKLFRRFRQSAPSASILVIGAGDMAHSIDGNNQSYDLLPDIRDAQKRAALQAGCAFWDLFEIMGGRNAILSWSKQGLASIDGHLSPKGQKIISEKLYNALMLEYHLYRYKQKKK